jgi:hypothetical protein
VDQGSNWGASGLFTIKTRGHQSKERRNVVAGGENGVPRSSLQLISIFTPEEEAMDILATGE